MNGHDANHPRWSELLRAAVTEPGIVSDAFMRFHGYSLGNQLLAFQQCRSRGIEPGPIATFPRWKELGRFVKRGEKAIILCQPITIKRKSDGDVETDGSDTPSSEPCFTKFVFKPHWFVLAQTDGAEYQPEPLPGWDETTALAALGIQLVPFAMLDGNVQGYAKDRTVAINPIAEQRESTMFHELAHIVLGHTAEGSVNSDSTDRTPRDIRELEAECVALLCCESLGLPGAAESRGYIQSWFHGRDVPERSVHRIFRATDEILKAGCAKRPEHPEEPA